MKLFLKFSGFFIFLSFLSAQRGPWNRWDDEPPGVYLRVDDRRSLVLPVRKIPSSEKGCDANTKFILGIIARPSEFQYRNFIRTTWGLPAYRECKTTKLIFLLGNSDDPSIDRQVYQESKTYQDILLLNYHESYYNVSRKIFGFFRYVYDHCPNVKCVLKGDSDTVINISGMERLCDVLPDNKHLITGKIVHFDPDRRPWGKHYVPFFVWHGGFPRFVLGFSYLMSGYDIIPKMLVNLQRRTPFLRSENYRRLAEDIVFAGIVPTMAGIELNYNDGFQMGGAFGFWNFNGMPIILSIESKDLPSSLIQISVNRREFFPEFSSQYCYQESLKLVPNGAIPKRNLVRNMVQNPKSSPRTLSLSQNIKTKTVSAGFRVNQGGSRVAQSQSMISNRLLQHVIPSGQVSTREASMNQAHVTETRAKKVVRRLLSRVLTH